MFSESLARTMDNGAGLIKLWK